MTPGAQSTTPTLATDLRRTLIGAVVLLAMLSAATLFTLALGDGTSSFRRAVAFTAVVCGAGSGVGWMISRLPCRNPATAVAASLAAVFLRLAIPLAALAWLQTEGHALREAGADRLLAGFYLLLLATDIVLNIMWSKKTAGSRDITIAN